MAKAYAACTSQLRPSAGESWTPECKIPPPAATATRSSPPCAASRTEKKPSWKPCCAGMKTSARQRRAGPAAQQDHDRDRPLCRRREDHRPAELGPTRHLALEAKLQKVIIHLSAGPQSAALALFREIEPRIKKDGQFYKICLALAFVEPRCTGPGRVFLQVPGLPRICPPLCSPAARVYANLAVLARDERQPEKARDLPGKSPGPEQRSRLQAELQAELKQLALIGQPAPPAAGGNLVQFPAAGRWPASRARWWSSISGPPGALPAGRCCPPCWMNAGRYKSQGLQVIGYTRLYGRYRDDTQKKKKVSAAEELA